MKLLKKKDLTYKNGYLIDKDNTAYQFCGQIAYDLNYLEDLVQKTQYNITKYNLLKEKHNVKVPDYEFKSEHSKNNVILLDMPKTPEHDKDEKRDELLKQEDEEVKNVEQFNELSEKIKSIYDLTESDEIEVHEVGGLSPKLDLYTIGNPLKLTSKDIQKYIQMIVDNDGMKCCKKLGIDEDLVKDALSNCCIANQNPIYPF